MSNWQSLCWKQLWLSPFRMTIGGATLLVFTAVFFIASNDALHLNAQESHFVYLPAITRPGDPFSRGENLLPNYSFEGGWYHPGDVPELQIPNDWEFTWQTGPTGFGDEPWDVWVRPEVRVLPREQLPPHEHPLFIWHGDQTIKIFKGFGAISFDLSTPLWLEAGTYVFEMSVFPDLVIGYNPDGSKIWAPDPVSGEVKLFAGTQTTAWILPTFGEKNTLYYVFTLAQTQYVPVGAAMRGRYAIRNNGWFMDDWWLWRQEEAAPGVYTGSGGRPFFADAYIPPPEPFDFPVGPGHD